MPSHKSPLTTLESLYTSASRHRLTVTIVTDDAEKLKRNISKAIDVQNMEANIKWPEQDAARASILETQNDVLQRLTHQGTTGEITDRPSNSKNSELTFEKDRSIENRKEIEHQRDRKPAKEIEIEESYGMGM